MAKHKRHREMKESRSQTQRRNSMLTRNLAAALFLLGASAAQAGILVQFTGATGNDWHYTVSMDPQVILSKANATNPASFFTIYDFKGLQSINWQPENGAGAASDWLTSTAGSSPDPKDTLPGDD